jgi:predicted nuclease of predicted toxin-antitoxin system
MRVLFDQGTPKPIKRYLPIHEVATAWEMGWSEKENGALLALAESSGFDVLVTTDKNLRYQQNLAGRRIALVVLQTTDWQTIEPKVSLIVQAIERVAVGSYEDVGFRAEI